MASAPGVTANDIAPYSNFGGLGPVDPTSGAYWTPNGQGGVNYFQNGSPITREAFANAINDQSAPGTIEQWAATNTGPDAKAQLLSPTTGGATGDTGGTAAGLQAYLDTAHQQMANLNSDYAAIGPAQDSAVAGINNAYTPQFNTLQSQLAQGQAANANSQQNLDYQRSASLRDLGSQLRGMNNSYQNQLGTAGAGNSSAAGLISSALSQEANKGRADVGQQYATQQTGLNQSNANLQSNYQNQADTLNAWKTDQLNKIAVQYGQEEAALRDQMLSVTSDEARTALYMQNQQAAQDALNQMQAVVTQHGNALQSLQSQFSNVQGPQADLSQYDNGYQVQQFTPEQIQGLSYDATQAPNPQTSNMPTFAPVGLTKNQTPQVGTLQAVG